MFRYILAFGSNLGDRYDHLEQGLRFLMRFSRILKISQWHETAPLSHPDYDTSLHKSYVNFVCEILTELDSYDLYKHIIVIEDEIGHPRTHRWAPREIDIDILFAAFQESEEKSDFFFCLPYKVSRDNFHIPHREIRNRLFLIEMIEKELFIPFQALEQHFKKEEDIGSNYQS